jgi:hypoxanthine phosphoribosyltransferase
MTDTEHPQILIAADEIAVRVTQMAEDIVAGLGPDLVMVVVLKGAFVFAADLLRALSRAGGRPKVEFVRLSSYGNSRTSRGQVTRIGELPDVAGQRVLVVDDVLDTGFSATYAVDAFRQSGAAEVRLCVLLDKPARRQVEVTADHIGFPVPDRFVVGYGIDYAERWRELPYIAVLD